MCAAEAAQEAIDGGLGQSDGAADWFDDVVKESGLPQFGSVTRPSAERRSFSRNCLPTMLDAMRQLVQLIRSVATDRQTLDELLAMIDDPASRRNGHALFDRIRDKTLKAERAKDGTLEAQYLFEEVCAKTLYNMSVRSAAFDADSPYWIVPTALHAARRMGIETSQVVAIVAGVFPRNRMRKLISSGSPYEPRVGISRAVRVGPIVTVAGTAPLGPDGRTVGRGDAAAQARRCLEIIAAALEAAGASMGNVVRTRILLTRIDDWQAVAAVHGEFFRDIRPVNTIMQVSRFIDPEWLVEIEADAVVDVGGDAV